ncbi:MAG: CPBP family intramembrane glutamic endopeptidase [Dokdonia sp.]|jgi:membrane protease YdiL (CAAX protease family)
MKNFKFSKKGWQYIAIVYLLSILPYYFILKEQHSESSFTLLLMWIPAIAAIIMRLYHKEGLFSQLRWNPLKDWKWLLCISFIPLLIEIVALLLTLGLDGAQLKPDFIVFSEGLIQVKGVAMIFGAAPQPWYLLLGNYVLSYLIAALLYSLFFGLGEEYGWRGYLQKEWAPHHSLLGYAAIGIVWGFWHLPAILLGHNYPEYPMLGGFVLMPILCVILSIVFGISLSKKQIIWAPVLFHGALNISTDVSNTVFIEESINRPIHDSIWSLLWLVTAILLWLTTTTKTPSR